ncbi:hypothetical protein ACUODF_59190, partial [Escherichia coli]
VRDVAAGGRIQRHKRAGYSLAGIRNGGVYTVDVGAVASVRGRLGAAGGHLRQAVLDHRYRGVFDASRHA